MFTLHVVHVKTKFIGYVYVRGKRVRTHVFKSLASLYSFLMENNCEEQYKDPLYDFVYVCFDDF